MNDLIGLLMFGARDFLKIYRTLIIIIIEWFQKALEN